MREVAAEAGVSLRLVQYYFGTKEELLLAAVHHLAVQFGRRAMERIRKVKETHNPVSPREVIAAILTQSLPQAVIDYHLDRLFPVPVGRYDRFS